MNNIDLKIDSQNMFEVLKNFPQQVRHANEIGRTAPLFNEELAGFRFLVLGMGGSAIGGDILSSYTSALPGADHISIKVNRGYNIPHDIDDDTNVIASSYSGNTEETLSGIEEASEYTDRIICITTGGKLKQIAEGNGYPVISVPSGYQPRCAVGYSFFPMLQLLMRSDCFNEEARDITEQALEDLYKTLDEKSALYSDINNPENEALSIAAKIKDTVPVIYSASERMEAVNLRWRCQINENAKALAFGNVIPEMNHNEINAWSYPEDLVKRFSVIFMEDPEDHERVKIRFNAVKSITSGIVPVNISTSGKSRYLLTRVFEMIYLGDWASFYLALLNHADPTPIPLINKLKNILSSHA